MQFATLRVIVHVGYGVDFPFIKHEAFSGLSMQQHNLYKYMFAPDVHPQTLAIIGCIAPLGPIPPALEMQGRFAARVLKVNYIYMYSIHRWSLWRNCLLDVEKCKP